MRRSYNKEVIHEIRQHIKECVYDENGDEYKTYKEAALRLVSEFQRVANHSYNISHQERFRDYMQGIPFNFEYMYYEQKKIVSQWLQSDPDNYTDQEAANMYYDLIYRTIKGFTRSGSSLN